MAEAGRAARVNKPSAAVSTRTTAHAPARSNESASSPPRGLERRLIDFDEPLADFGPAILPAGRAPILQRRCACAGTNETCETCGVQRRAIPVSTPGDALERDADRAAGRALRFLGGDVSARTAVPIVQRAATAPTATHADSSAIMSRLGGGRPLDGTTRGRMESAFGSSFAGIRIHDDSGAAALSRKLDAHAFTLGEHIAFSPGAYRPGTRRGDELLAHELAHTIQQRGGAPLIARSLAGNCAEPLENVDEQRDELSRAGREAHIQIQYYFESRLKDEAPLPRATKKRSRACPGVDTPLGYIDLFANGRVWSQIGEIKSAEGAAYAEPDVRHYIRRANEAAGRLSDGKPCAKEKSLDAEDLKFDKKYYRGQIQKTGKKPEFVPLETVVPTTKTDLGPFAGNPLEKNLFCERRAGGAVIYWCTKNKSKKRRNQKQDVKSLPLVKPEAVKQPAKKRIRVTDAEQGFYDMARRMNDENQYGAPGRDLIVAIDPDLYNAQMRQVFEDQQRHLRPDPRGMPIVQLGIPIVGLAPMAGVLVVVLVAMVVAPAALAALPVALAATEGAVVLEGAAATTAALETGAATTTAAFETGAATTTAAFETGAATTTALEGGTAATTAGAAVTGTTVLGTTYTSGGVTLTAITGGGGGVAAATVGGTGTTVIATIAKGSAAAAALVYVITKNERSANAAEIVKPLLDKPLVIIRDVTGSAAPALSSTVTANGKPFKVVMQLTSRD